MTKYYLNNLSESVIQIQLTCKRNVKPLSSLPLNDKDIIIYNDLKAKRHGHPSILDNLVLSTIKIEDDSRYESWKQSAKQNKEDAKQEEKAKRKAEEQAAKEEADRLAKEQEEKALKEKLANLPEECKPCYADGKVPSDKDCKKCKEKSEEQEAKLKAEELARKELEEKAAKEGNK